MPNMKPHDEKRHRSEADHSPGGSPSSDRSRNADTGNDENQEDNSRSKSGNHDDRKGESSSRHSGGRSR